MIERVCPRCQAGNPADHLYCGTCGTSLNQPLTRRAPASLAQRTIRLPAHWKQASKVVALSVATLAAEAGLAWLQRRQQAATPPATLPSRQRSQVVAIGRRISETWIDGQLQHRTDEQIMWLKPDDQR